MKNWIKENKLMAAAAAVVLAILVFGISQFLFTKDEGGITGVQALKELGKEFWIWGVALTLAAMGGFYLVGKHVWKMGGYGVPLSVLLPSLLLLVIAWTKGCDVKTDGIGGRHHVPTKQTDTLRQSAEDMLKQEK